MSTPRPPRLAVALLRLFEADPAFVGDLAEEFQVRRSRVWFWKQVLGSLPTLLAGRTRDTVPHRWKPVNLQVTPRGSPVGGLGLLAIAMLVTLVSPQAWWLIVIGGVAGMALGAVLIVVGQRRASGRPPDAARKILLPVALLLSSGVPASTPAALLESVVDSGRAGQVERAPAR